MKLRKIVQLVGGELIGDGEIEITSVADITHAKAGDLAFCEKPGAIPETNASCVLAETRAVASVPLDNPAETRAAASVPAETAMILVANPKLAFAKAAAVILKSDNEAFIHPSASIADSTNIGSGTKINAGVGISENVTIGENCVIHPNVVIYANSTLGNNVVLHAGVVIGADGFGYVKDETGEYIKFPQIGNVVIESNVEIGANTCIDRGALGETRIGEGTKIDNLVQVGHNVSVGKRCVIAAQTGISGSVIIEDDCVIGGQVGFGDHVHVQSGAIIGSQAGVLPGKIVRPGVWWGTPIQPLNEYKRQNAMVKGLARLREDVKELKKRDHPDKT